MTVFENKIHLYIITLKKILTAVLIIQSLKNLNSIIYRGTIIAIFSMKFIVKSHPYRLHVFSWMRQEKNFTYLKLFCNWWRWCVLITIHQRSRQSCKFLAIYDIVSVMDSNVVKVSGLSLCIHWHNKLFWLFLFLLNVKKDVSFFLRRN